MKTQDGQILKLVVDSNEESLFFLLKAYFEQNKDVELVGVHKEHYLLDKTEFYVKVAGKKDPVKIVKKALADVKKDLESKKLK